MRLDGLHKRLGPPLRDFPSERLRSLRAVQALEWIGSEKAAELLVSLAKGNPWALQTREAKGALRRMSPRKAGD